MFAQSSLGRKLACAQGLESWRKRAEALDFTTRHRAQQQRCQPNHATSRRHLSSGYFLHVLPTASFAPRERRPRARTDVPSWSLKHPSGGRGRHSNQNRFLAFVQAEIGFEDGNLEKLIPMDCWDIEYVVFYVTFNFVRRAINNVFPL